MTTTPEAGTGALNSSQARAVSATPRLVERAADEIEQALRGYGFLSPEAAALADGSLDRITGAVLEILRRRLGAGITKSQIPMTNDKLGFPSSEDSVVVPAPVFTGVNSSRNPGSLRILDPGVRRGDDLGRELVIGHR